MTLDSDLLNQLQQRRQRIQNLFGSGQPFSPIRKDIGGSRYLSAFSRMRALRPENLPMQNIRVARQISSSLANQMADFAGMVHLPVGAVASQNAYGAFEPVFPTPQPAAHPETPAQPGELRAGMAISRMATVPQPGQSIAAFREQTKASGLVKAPSAKSTVVKTPPAPTPGTKVFSKVVEGKQGQAPVEKLPEPPQTPAVNINLDASEPAILQDEPANASMAPKVAAERTSPPIQGNRPSVSDKPTQKGAVPPVLQRQVEAPAKPLPVRPSAQTEPVGEQASRPSERTAATPAIPEIKPVDEVQKQPPEQQETKFVSQPKPSETRPSSSLPALPKAVLLAKPQQTTPVKPRSRVAPLASTPVKVQPLRQQQSPAQPGVVQKQADPAADHLPVIVDPGLPTQPSSGQAEGQPQTQGQTPKAVPAQQQARLSVQPAQPMPPLQEKLQRNTATKNLAIQRQPLAIHPRPRMQIGKPAELAIGKLTSQNQPQPNKPLELPNGPAQTESKGKPAVAEKQNFASPASMPLAMPTVVQRLPAAKTTPAVSVAPVVSQPANTTSSIEPALPTSSDHIPTVGIQRQNPGNVVQRLWEEHSDIGGQPSGGPSTGAEASAASEQDVEGLAKKILPLVKHYLEIELERVGGRFGR